MVQASGPDASWTSPLGDVLVMLIREETLGHTEDMLERLFLSAGLGTSWCPPGGNGGSGRGKERLDLSAKTTDPMTQNRISCRKQKKL